MLLKRSFLGLVLVSVSWVATAQLTDTITVPDNQLYETIPQRMYENPLLYHRYQVHDYTKTSIFYQHQSQGLQRVQTPEIANSYQFTTEGLFNFSEKLRVLGSFQYERLLEQSVPYTLSSARTNQQAVLAPHYFFAPKAGDWKNERYALNAVVSYQLSPRVSIGGIIKYNNQQFARTIDPRPEITQNTYGVNLLAGYTYQQHHLSVKAGLGRHSTTGSIIYVDDSQNAPVQSETFTRFMAGYGRVVFNTSYNRYLERALPENVGIDYAFQQGKHQLSVGYQYQKAIKNFYQNVSGSVYFDEELVTYKFKHLSHEFSLRYDQDNPYWDHYLEASYQQEQGDNYAVIDQGQNFRSTLDAYTLSWQSSYTKNQQVILSGKLQADYTQQQTIDLLGYTSKTIDALGLQAEVNSDLWKTSKNRLNAGISLNGYFPTQERLVTRAVTSDTQFTEEVVVPDHAFDASARLMTGVNVNFTIHLPQTKKLRLFAAYEHLSLLNDAYQSYNVSLRNQTSQYFKTGIILFY